MKAKHQGRQVLRSEPRFHLARPKTARGAIFGDFFEEVVMSVEEERKSGSEIVYVQSRFNSRLHIGQPIVQSERQLLNRGGSGFADMIAADADGMVAWRRFDAEANDVVDDLERGRRRTDPLFLCDIFFQYVVLQCPLKMSGAISLAFSYRQIHGEKNNRGAVDGHRYAHLIERDVAKECFHV